jgi:hypothetical protein
MSDIPLFGFAAGAVTWEDIDNRERAAEVRAGVDELTGKFHLLVESILESDELPAGKGQLVREAAQELGRRIDAAIGEKEVRDLAVAVEAMSWANLVAETFKPYGARNAGDPGEVAPATAARLEEAERRFVKNLLDQAGVGAALAGVTAELAYSHGHEQSGVQVGLAAWLRDVIRWKPGSGPPGWPAPEHTGSKQALSPERRSWLVGKLGEERVKQIEAMDPDQVARVVKAAQEGETAFKDRDRLPTWLEPYVAMFGVGL